MNRFNKFTRKTTGFTLPNNSGEHVRGYKREAPVRGYDLVNKDYVDTEISGITLDEINDPVADKTFTLANKTITWRLTNPAGGMLWDFVGNASGHLLEINQNTGNVSAGTHLLHIEADDTDALPLHLTHSGAAGTDCLEIGTATTNTAFRVDNTGNLTLSGSIVMVDGSTVDGVDVSNLSLSVQNNYSEIVTISTSLTSLTNDSMADSLHRHSELSAADGSPNPALYVDATGKVGVGATTLYAKFQMGGADGSNGGDFYCFNLNGSPRVLFGDSATGGQFGGMQWDSATDTVRVYHSTATSTQLRLNADTSIWAGGNITISRNLPTFYLQDDGGNITEIQNGNSQFVIDVDPSNSVASTDILFKMDGSEVGRFLQGGNFGIGTTAPTALLDVNSDTIRLRTSRTITTSTDTGNQGDICWDSSYIYVCISTDTWVRAGLATW